MGAKPKIPALMVVATNPLRTTCHAPFVRERSGVAGDLTVAGLTVLAPTLGGATEQWAQAIVVLLCGAVILWKPPRHWPPGIVLAAFGALVLLAVLSFLPVNWFPPARWRADMLPDPGLELPNTYSLQPWRSLQCGLLLGSGLVWAAYLASRDWVARRSVVLSVYAGGVVVLGALVIGFSLADYVPPFWKPADQRYGFFPNRNQTGNVLALGGVLALALAFHNLHRRRAAGYVWAASSALLGVAVVMNYSRAGVLLLLLGSLAWLVWLIAQRHEGKPTSLGLAGVLFGLSLFVMLGGKTWERFHRMLGPTVDLAEELRGPMHAAALALMRQTTWTGVGMGNFDSVFARHREKSGSEKRAIHPESDWLWLGVEMGWAAPVLVLAAVIGWLYRHWPGRVAGNFHLRSALAVCVIGFTLHGFVDVSGHRMGAVWPALLFLGLLRSDDRGTKSSWRAQWVFSGLAVAMLAAAAWWLAAVWAFETPPTAAQARQAKSRIRRLLEHRAYDQAMALSTKALEYAPLDAELYVHRALAQVRGGGGVAEALTDFHRARHFEPNDANWCYVEGVVWLERVPILAVAPWRVAIERAKRSRFTSRARMGQLYREMLAIAGNQIQVRSGLRSIADDDRDLLLAFLGQANQQEFGRDLDRLLLEDPRLESLTPQQRSTLFVTWAKVGNRELLAKTFEAHPDWIATGWRGLALVLAGRREFAQACALVRQYADVPVLPTIVKPGPIADLKRDFLRMTNDFYTGFSLYRAQAETQDVEGALITLGKLTRQANAPEYLHYLEAELRSSQGAWPEAWTAWRRYLGL